MLLDMGNQNIKEALKKFHDNKNKEYEKTKKQMYEIIRALNKHQSETENTINRGVKEEMTHDMENLRKKNELEIQKQSGRPFQQNTTNRRQNLRT
jgi:hypothetical protein